LHGYNDTRGPYRPSSQSEKKEEEEAKIDTLLCPSLMKHMVSAQTIATIRSLFSVHV